MGTFYGQIEEIEAVFNRFNSGTAYGHKVDGNKQVTLELLGYRLLPRPGDNFIIAGLASEIVIKEHYWNCPDTGQAGNAIDFLVKIRGVTFNEAMTMLTSGPMDHNGGE